MWSVFSGRFLGVLSSLGDSYPLWLHWELPMHSVLTGSFLCVLFSLGDSRAMQSVMVVSEEMCRADFCAAIHLTWSACAA